MNYSFLNLRPKNMSQKNHSGKDRKKLLESKNKLEKQIKDPRKKGKPESDSVKKAQHEIGKVKKSLSKK